MKQLQIQLQPQRSPELQATEAVSRLTRLSERVRVTEGEDNAQYISLDFTTADLSSLWSVIRRELQATPGLAKGAIIVCEGEHGREDYLLLHHFDPQQQLDTLN
ncbi:MAG: hypothetical protein WD468_00560 [Pirellulales bacterium]